MNGLSAYENASYQMKVGLKQNFTTVQKVHEAPCCVLYKNYFYLGNNKYVKYDNQHEIGIAISISEYDLQMKFTVLQ